MREMCLVWVLSILLGLAASSSLEFADEWQVWKSQHGKWYGSVGKEVERHKVWLQNREFIERHNKNSDIHGYTLALNHFGDLVTKYILTIMLVARATQSSVL